MGEEVEGLILRAVLDTNVLVSSLLARNGKPAQIVRQWQQGAFELIVSPMLLGELERVLHYPKLRKHPNHPHVPGFLETLRSEAQVTADPVDDPSVRSIDPDDDYLIALASHAGAVLVSGDSDLLDLSPRIPVYSPAGFLEILNTEY